jgi:hypothetical protein
MDQYDLKHERAPQAAPPDGRELERAAIQKGFDVFLSLGSIQLIPRLNLRDEIILAFEGSEILVGELSPLRLNFVYDHFSVLGSWNIFHDVLLNKRSKS